MNDPHVQSLTYRLETAPSLSFINASALECETEHFSIRLESEKLTVLMKEHHSSVESAQARVTPFLRSWELDHYLRAGPNAMAFVFEDAEMIDRKPPPEGIYAHLASGSYKISGSAMNMTYRPSKYPEPPSGLGVSPDVETMWNRLEGYDQGREPLTSMTYFPHPCRDDGTLGARETTGSPHPSAVAATAGSSAEPVNRNETGGSGD
jgi:hypothetical protein